MANRTFDPLQTLGKHLKVIAGSFAPNGVSAISSASNKGLGWSVARTGVGHYTITLQDSYPHLIASFVNLRLVSPAGYTIHTGAYDSAAKTIKVYVHKTAPGFLPLSLFDAREVGASYAPINAAGNGGVLASDTTPLLAVLSSAKEIGITWAASNNDELAWNLALPPDFDDSVAATFYAMARVTKAGGAIVDHVPLTVAAFFGENGTDAGGDTTHITTGTAMAVSKALTQANQTAYPGSLMIGLKPTAHTTDVINVSACWLEYTRKLLVDLPANDNNRINFELVVKNSSVSPT